MTGFLDSALLSPKHLLTLALMGFASLITVSHATTSATYLEHPEFRAFLQEVTAQDGHDREQLLALFSTAQRLDSVLSSIARPAERTLTWADYRRIFMTDTRIEQGIAFHQQHAATLKRAEQQFGVPSTVIVAILGVETLYGQRKGEHRVLDALATLAFDYPPRARFFRGQLREFLKLADEANIDLASAKGSYAGAMGYPQFIPGSYRHYAIDYDDDGRIDLLNSPVDAIGSIANYLQRHQWQAGSGIALPASADNAERAAKVTLFTGKGRKSMLPASELAQHGLAAAQPLANNTGVLVMRLDGKEGIEYWLGLNNFYAITRYNHSHLYAMAVYQLSEAIEQSL